MSLNNHLKHLWVVLYGAIVIALGSLFLHYYKYGYINYTDAFRIGIIIFLLFHIPQLIIHFNYYFINRSDTLYYNQIERKITIEKKGVSVTFSFDDIKIIKRVKTFPFAEQRLHILPWDSYNYSLIKLMNGNEYIITNLLVLNMDLPLSSEKIKLIKTLYPIAFKD